MITEVTLSIPSGGKRRVEVTRNGGSVQIRHAGPDRADFSTPIHFDWNEFVKVAQTVDEFRKLFGEKTAMDH